MNAYRIDRSYLWNYRHGPSLALPPPRVPATPPKDFFGHRVASRLGIAAGILLSSRWIERFARLGFDILTYKTVRSAYRPCYPLPNWVYVEEDDKAFRVRSRRPRAVAATSSAVCFGMPSMAPEVWRADVRRARRVLGRGQLLVVSVVGTPRYDLAPVDARAELIDDYVRCARWAAAAGAHIVEANLSCPNVTSAEGEVYQNAPLSRALAAALREALPSTPLWLKVGQLGGAVPTRRLYGAVRGLVDGIVLVNGIAARVLRRDGRPAFPGHESVGILGRAIHEPAVACVRQAAAAARQGRRMPATIAVGGVLGPEDAADFFAAGAVAVLLGGGAALDPSFAARAKEEHPEW